MTYLAENSEKAFIGCLILDPDLIEIVVDKGLTPKWMSDEGNERILEIILESFEEGITLDSNTLADKGIPLHVINELMDSVSSIEFFNQYLYNVGIARLNEAMQSRMIRNPEDPQSVRSLIDSFDDKFTEKEAVNVKYISEEMSREVMEKEPKIEIKLPWPGLNILLGGVKRQKLYFVGGLPGHRKTDFVINIADYVLEQGFNVLYCDYEMGESDTFSRFVTKRKEIPNTWIETRKNQFGKALSEEEREVMSNHIIEYGNDESERLKIVCYPRINEIKNIAKSMNADVICIDHIQLFCEEHPMRKGDTKPSHINSLCRRLKKLARELDVAIICPSQIDKNMEGPPRKKDFKESAGMMENGDVLIGIWWPHAEQKAVSSKGVACTMNFLEYEIAKHRGGPVGRGELYVQVDTGHMREFEKKEDPVYSYQGGNEL